MPPGVSAVPAVLDGFVKPEGEREYEITLTADHKQVPGGVQMVPFDITLDGKRYGEMFDFLILARPANERRGEE